MEDILTSELLGNSPRNWAVALSVTIVLFFGLRLARRGLANATSRLVRKTPADWDDAIATLLQRTHWSLLLGLAVLIGSQTLELSEGARKAVSKGVVLLLVLQGGFWGSFLVRWFSERYRERKLKKDPGAAASLTIGFLVVRVAVWAVVALLVLANLDIEIGPLLAGLGVGGLAMALAVQTVLKDLLASLSIALDKPFVVGDFLIFGELMGTVEYIGIKSTRLRSLSGEQLIFANNDLLESRIRNFGRMRERRAAFTIGVTYQTPREKLGRIPAMMRAAIESQALTRFDRSHFRTYGAYSLDFETVYFVQVPDMVKYLDIQQAVNLAVHEAFEREDIEFAYPTQTLFVERPRPAS